MGKQNKMDRNFRKPLLDNNPELREIEDKSRKIYRMADELEEFSKELNNMSLSQYKEESRILNEKLDDFPNLLKSFYDTVSKAKSFDGYSDLVSRKENYVKISEY